MRCGQGGGEARCGHGDCTVGAPAELHVALARLDQLPVLAEEEVLFYAGARHLERLLAPANLGRLLGGPWLDRDSSAD